MSDTSSIAQTRSDGKALTRRQKESMQVLLQALTDFVLEDRYDVESISDFDYEEISDKKRLKKTSAERFNETDVEPNQALIPPGPPDRQLKENLVNACNSLLRESITFEYSLRPLGAGGPGMFGAWVLRQSLRAFSEVLEKCSMDELYRIPDPSSFEERDVLGCFIDEFPGALYDLWKAFDELESFLLDFVAFFHSIDLTRVLHSLKASIKKQHVILLNQKSKTRISVVAGQNLRSGLLSFFSELEKYFQVCSTELTEFRKQGIPLIRASQSGQSDRYLMLTTISTFFSAVTSATLQIAFQESPGNDIAVLGPAVNTFFFSSLIFSTASAVQALLAMAWKRSFIRVPEENMIFHWVSKGPLFSLVIAGLFFAVGLCLFIIASQKSSPTTFLSVGFALVHAVGLVGMAIWFVHEQWKFRKETGAIGRKLTETSVTVSLLVWVAKVWQSRFIGSFSSALSSAQRLMHRRGKGIAVKRDVEHGNDNFDMTEARPKPEGRRSTDSRSSVVANAPFSTQEFSSDNYADNDASYHTFRARRLVEGGQSAEPDNSFVADVAESSGQVYESTNEDLKQNRGSQEGARFDDNIENSDQEETSDMDPVIYIEPPSRPESVDSLPGSEPPTSRQIYNALQAISEERDSDDRSQSDTLRRVSASSIVEVSEHTILDDIYGRAYGIGDRRLVDSPVSERTEMELGPWVSVARDDATPRAIPGTHLVDEPLPLTSAHAHPGTSGGVQATPLSEMDLLTVRRESWQQDLRQESISYMEMYNRRNPKKKRAYPPDEPPDS